MAPVVHGLEAKYGDQVTFVYLDIDDPATGPFKSQLGYLYQPHLFLLNGHGTPLNQWLGYTTGAELEAALVAAIG